MQPQEFDVDFGEVTRGEVSGVSSVNGKTGAVILTAEDLGADTSEQVDTKIATAKSEVEAEIPVVNNATLTIQKNSTTIDTFTANSSTNKTVNITVPTKTSDITNDSSYQTANEVQEAILVETNARIAADNALGQSVDAETAARQAADNNLQGQIDAITSSSDVVDVVGTYAELQEYDTTHLKDNDIVKVLVDETHNDAITYYRWTHSTTPYSWVYIGSQGPFYTKSEADALLNDKQDTLTAGEGISLVDNEIGVDFDVVATNTRVAEEQTRAEAAEQALGDAIPELLSSTGQSTTAGMTQKAITDALASAGGVKVLTTDDYDYPIDNPARVAVWNLEPGVYTAPYANLAFSNSFNVGYGYVVIVGGKNSSNEKPVIYTDGRIVGKLKVNSNTGSESSRDTLITFGDVVNNLTSTSSSAPLSARQGKVLKDLIDSLIISGSGAPTTATVGTVGQLYEDTTNGDLYQCTAVSGSTYTWEEVGGGGGSQVLYNTVYGTNTDGSPTQAAVSSALSYDNTIGNVRIGTDKTVGSSDYNVVIGAVENVSGSSASVAIGHDVNTQSSTRSVAVGNRSKAKGGYRVAIGEGADAQANQSIALGSHSTATAQGEMNIGTPQDTTAGYDGTPYRLLTGLHDPISDHDAATKKYVDDHSGGGVNVVQTTGTSTTDVMSQKATSDLVCTDGNKSRIAIGGGTHSMGFSGVQIGDNTVITNNGLIAIGNNAQTYASRSMAIGHTAQIDSSKESCAGSIALGAFSGGNIAASGMMDIGSSNTTYGYNNTNYRLLTGVHDGVNAHDAVNKQQLDAALAQITALEARIAALEGNA